MVKIRLISDGLDIEKYAKDSRVQEFSLSVLSRYYFTSALELFDWLAAAFLVAASRVPVQSLAVQFLTS
jgi:hypothetical protein